MAENYYTILTDIGLAKFTNAHITQDKVNLAEIAVGDSSGSYYNPISSQTALNREVWRGPISLVEIDPNNPNWIVAEAVIPSSAGGFTIREIGLFDNVGDLIAVGKYPAAFKPQLDQGSVKDLYIRMIIESANASSVTLKVDPAIILASRKYVDDKVASSVGTLGQDVTDVQTNLTTHMAETVTEGVHGLTAERTRKITFGTADPNPATMEEGEVYFQYE